jgi:hypothetical protein
LSGKISGFEAVQQVPTDIARYNYIIVVHSFAAHRGIHIRCLPDDAKFSFVLALLWWLCYGENSLLSITFCTEDKDDLEYLRTPLETLLHAPGLYAPGLEGQ